jgi:hypothetical protein
LAFVKPQEESGTPLQTIARPVALLSPVGRPQDCFVSSFFRIRRSSMKFNAVIVQSTLPNIIITMLSIEAGSSPAWLLFAAPSP